MYVIICWRLRPSLGFSGARGGGTYFSAEKKNNKKEKKKG